MIVNTITPINPAINTAPTLPNVSTNTPPLPSPITVQNQNDSPPILKSINAVDLTEYRNASTAPRGNYKLWLLLPVIGWIVYGILSKKCANSQEAAEAHLKNGINHQNLDQAINAVHPAIKGRYQLLKAKLLLEENKPAEALEALKEAEWEVSDISSEFWYMRACAQIKIGASPTVPAYSLYIAFKLSKPFDYNNRLAENLTREIISLIVNKKDYNSIGGELVKAFYRENIDVCDRLALYNIYGLEGCLAACEIVDSWDQIRGLNATGHSLEWVPGKEFKGEHNPEVFYQRAAENAKYYASDCKKLSDWLFNLAQRRRNSEDRPAFIAEAEKWLKKAADLGDLSAQATSGLYRQSEDQRRQTLNQSAEAGDPQAQFESYRLYMQDAQKDEKRAIENLQKAAAQGHYQAQIELGTLYETGKSSQISQDIRQAIILFRKAFYNNAPAMMDYKKAAYDHAVNHLGRLETEYPDIADIVDQTADMPKKNWKAYGRSGVWDVLNCGEKLYRGYHSCGGDRADCCDANKNAAVGFINAAARAGYRNAQVLLGECFLNGNGVRVNKDAAKKWFEIAVNNAESNSGSGNSIETYLCNVTPAW